MLPIEKSNNRRASSTFYKEVGKYKLLTLEEEIDLAAKAKNGDIEARNKLVVSNIRFAFSCAKKYDNLTGMSYDERVAVASMGLIKAAKRFDETRGFKFISYAVWWIKQSLLEKYKEDVRTVRVPVNVQELAEKAFKIIDEFMKNNEGQEPSDEYIEKELLENHGKKYKGDISFLLSTNYNERSLDDYLRSEKDKRCLINIIEDLNVEKPEEKTDSESLGEDIEDLLNGIPEREALILKKYFGIGYDRAITLQEIGDELNLTRERVRQLKERALRRMRHESRAGVLRTYLG